MTNLAEGNASVTGKHALWSSEKKKAHSQAKRLPLGGPVLPWGQVAPSPRLCHGSESASLTHAVPVEGGDTHGVRTSFLCSPGGNQRC